MRIVHSWRPAPPGLPPTARQCSLVRRPACASATIARPSFLARRGPSLTTAADLAERFFHNSLGHSSFHAREPRIEHFDPPNRFVHAMPRVQSPQMRLCASSILRICSSANGVARYASHTHTLAASGTIPEKENRTESERCSENEVCGSGREAGVAHNPA